ncbi:hypothetical protein M8C21_008708 [Ambrosia artemisiifolia]|uniref:Uncharacterized protein n=1 Tax=Ambrosia artemisiifolia TaxID=4212 RepID=A0AAD5D0W0_AMBAR|nr:hypothetical protein M8C21_008708 [Ambrosia artemisiifolia]
MVRPADIRSFGDGSTKSYYTIHNGVGSRLCSSG